MLCSLVTFVIWRQSNTRSAAIALSAPFPSTTKILNNSPKRDVCDFWDFQKRNDNFKPAKTFLNNNWRQQSRYYPDKLTLTEPQQSKFAGSFAVRVLVGFSPSCYVMLTSSDSLKRAYNNNYNNNNKIFITVSMYLAHRANWGHLLLQN